MRSPSFKLCTFLLGHKHTTNELTLVPLTLDYGLFLGMAWSSISVDNVRTVFVHLLRT